jgi:MoxR-like ATPase
MIEQTIESVRTQAAAFQDCIQSLKREIGRVFIGQEHLVEHLLWCAFCGGHALIEGVPGLGKTLLVNTLSRSLDLRFSRVQCTPDLMPADIIGTNLLIDDAAGGREFRFQPGPVFAHIVLADEINRATPKTQSAFLEAMQEHYVTVFGVRHRLEEPFCVFATQNPIEMEGTYPLPEAQLDRFFFKLKVRLPSVDELSQVMSLTTSVEVPAITSRYGPDAVRSMSHVIRQVQIAEEIKRVALRVMLGTHPESSEATPMVRKYVRYGASPRAAQAMILAGKARALANGRYHVAAEDIHACAAPALLHRILLNFEAEMQQVTAEAVVNEVLRVSGL